MKAVQLTDEEIEIVLKFHAEKIVVDKDAYSFHIERMKYLNKRLEDQGKEKPVASTSWNNTQNG